MLGFRFEQLGGFPFIQVEHQGRRARLGIRCEFSFDKVSLFLLLLILFISTTGTHIWLFLRTLYTKTQSFAHFGSVILSLQHGA